ncbi:MAG: hypothetical protein LAP38_04475 [Acidobacteriia bacterium]|nr:hypothetical protein [Terriglobia bacterium]
MRMQMRRFTRLTKAFSKESENPDLTPEEGQRILFGRKRLPAAARCLLPAILLLVMDFSLEWGDPLPLAQSQANGIYEVNLDAIPTGPGIYIFFRAFGDAAEALYVGKAGGLRGRIKTQMNAVKLMKGIENAAIGPRYVVAGEFKARPGQRQHLLPVIERAMIRYYLTKGHELLNFQGTHIRKHSLASQRRTKILRDLIPKDIYFEL